MVDRREFLGGLLSALGLASVAGIARSNPPLRAAPRWPDPAGKFAELTHDGTNCNIECVGTSQYTHRQYGVGFYIDETGYHEGYPNDKWGEMMARELRRSTELMQADLQRRAFS